MPEWKGQSLHGEKSVHSVPTLFSSSLSNAQYQCQTVFSTQATKRERKEKKTPRETDGGLSTLNTRPALSGSHSGLNKDAESLEMASFWQRPRGKKESSQLATFLTLTERPWPQPLKHWKEEVGGLRGSPKDSQVFSSWPVSLKFYLPLRRQHSLFLINSALRVPSWRTETALSSCELKVECISLDWRQIWLREGRGLLALGTYHYESSGGWWRRAKLQLFCTVWRLKVCARSGETFDRHG